MLVLALCLVPFVDERVIEYQIKLCGPSLTRAVRYPSASEMSIAHDKALHNKGATTGGGWGGGPDPSPLPPTFLMKSVITVVT